MSEYTPTTGQMRDVWEGLDRDDIEAREEFDRWFAEVERAAAEKAWDEGFDAGERDVFEHEKSSYDTECIQNPYREGKR